MNKLNPGDQAPAFSLPDQNGQRVKLGDFKGQKLLRQEVRRNHSIFLSCSVLRSVGEENRPPNRE